MSDALYPTGALMSAFLPRGLAPAPQLCSTHQLPRETSLPGRFVNLALGSPPVATPHCAPQPTLLQRSLFASVITPPNSRDGHDDRCARHDALGVPFANSNAGGAATVTAVEASPLSGLKMLSSMASPHRRHAPGTLGGTLAHPATPPVFVLPPTPPLPFSFAPPASQPPAPASFVIGRVGAGHGAQRGAGAERSSTARGPQSRDKSFHDGDDENEDDEDAVRGGGGRKEKSLGLLCDNFLRLYSTSSNTMLCLDAVAASLAVERRRVYDIINVLEGVELVRRRAKNVYVWLGAAGLPATLARLKGLALRTNAVLRPGPMPLRDDCAEGDGDGEGDSNVKAASRVDRSLGILVQRFVMMFLARETNLIYLEEAAEQLLGNGDPAKVKSKVRRLYDISNILGSLGLVEKTFVSAPKAARRTAFRWIGIDLRALPADTAAAARTAAVEAGAGGSAPTGRPSRRMRKQSLLNDSADELGDDGDAGNNDADDGNGDDATVGARDAGSRRGPRKIRKRRDGDVHAYEASITSANGSATIARMASASAGAIVVGSRRAGPVALRKTGSAHSLGGRSHVQQQQYHQHLATPSVDESGGRMAAAALLSAARVVDEMQAAASLGPAATTVHDGDGCGGGACDSVTQRLITNTQSSFPRSRTA